MPNQDLPVAPTIAPEGETDYNELLKTVSLACIDVRGHTACPTDTMQIALATSQFPPGTPQVRHGAFPPSNTPLGLEELPILIHPGRPHFAAVAISPPDLSDNRTPSILKQAEIVDSLGSIASRLTNERKVLARHSVENDERSLPEVSREVEGQ